MIIICNDCGKYSSSCECEMDRHTILEAKQVKTLDELDEFLALESELND